MADGNTPTPRARVVDQIFGPGHNNPPIEDVLKADFAGLAAEIEQATKVAAAKAPKKVKDDADLTICGSILTGLREIERRAEDIRKAEKEPVFHAGKAIDAFFKDLMGMLSAAAKPVQAAADDYARRKAAEERELRRRQEEEARRRAEAERQKAENARSAEAAAKAAARAEAFEAEADGAGQQKSGPVRGGGVTASSRATWDFEIVDYSTVDLEAIRPFLARDAVEKAIRAKVRIDKGSTNIRGVRVFEGARATFRT